MGTIIKSHQTSKEMLDKVTNVAISAKGPWLKVALVGMMIGLGIFIIWFMYDSGVLEDFGLEGMFGDIGPSEEDLIMKQYSPEQLKVAVDSGELVYDDLPREIQKMYDSQLEGEGGTVTATPIP